MVSTGDVKIKRKKRVPCLKALMERDRDMKRKSQQQVMSAVTGV